MLSGMTPYLPPFHFLHDMFDRKLQQYIEADLVGYHSRVLHRKWDPKQFENYKEPFAVLTLEELEAGFVVSLVPLVACFIVFVTEWIPTVKDLLVFLVIFKKYFEMKKLEQNQKSHLMKTKIAAFKAEN